MQILKASLLYFSIVFGAGFIVSIIRTLRIAPQIGPRVAALMESLVMLGAVIGSASWTVAYLAVPFTWPARFAMGFIALGLMLIAEFGIVLPYRGQSAKEYFATRDPVARTVYYALLGMFAVMPQFVGKT